MIVLVIGAFFIVLATTTFKNGEGKPLVNFKGLVDIATATSFVLAPIAGFLNYKIIFNEEVGEKYRPPFYLILCRNYLMFIVFYFIYILSRNEHIRYA